MNGNGNDWDKDNPLDRIKGESRAANTALRDYYLMGAGRSLRKLLGEYIQHDSHKPPTKKFNTLETWSRKNFWQKRVVAQKAIDDTIALEQFRERHMSGDEVIAHLSDMASDKVGVNSFFRYDEEGNADGLDWAKIQQYGHLIKTITFTRNGPKLELYSRLDALDKMARYYGLYTDKAEVALEGNLKGYLEVSPDDWDADTG